MVISYPSHITWIKHCTDAEVLHNFSRSTRQKLQSTIPKVSTLIRHAIEPIGPDFFQWFRPLYESNLVRKNNPNIFPLEALLAVKQKTYQALTLYENEVPMGATIFVITAKGNLSTVYRAYRPGWQQQTLRASPALYAEYLLEREARRSDCERILHGRDRNPYGLHSGIGVALFKLSIGCVPYVSTQHTREEIDLTEIHQDIAVFVYPGLGVSRISNAYLSTTSQTAAQWLGITKYPEQVLVTNLVRSSAAAGESL